MNQEILSIDGCGINTVPTSFGPTFPEISIQSANVSEILSLPVSPSEVRIAPPPPGRLELLGHA